MGYARLFSGTLCIFLMVAIAACVSSLQPAQAQKAAKKYPYAYNAKYWRHKKGSITNADRERMAKFTAYMAGRYKGQGKPLAMDTFFREHLKANRMKFVAAIAKKNGLQVTLVKDLDTGRYIILPRGSEFDTTSGDATIDGKADVSEILSGQLKVGKKQYESGKKQIGKWIKKYQGNIEVIGHSLGAAIAQRIALDYGKDIARVTVFNSPGIEVETVAQALETPSKMRGILNPDGSSKVHIFNVKTDVVGRGGDIHIPADVVFASGGKLNEGRKKAHTQLIFADGVKREPQDWSKYEKAREVDKGLKSRVWGYAVDRYNNPLGGKEGNVENVPYTIDRLNGYHQALLREAKQKELKERRRKKKERGKELKKAALAAIAKEKNAIDAGRKPKVKAKAPKPVVKTPTPKPVIKTTQAPPTATTPATTPSPQPVIDRLEQEFTGSFTGTQIRLAEGAKIKGGKMQFTVSGRDVAGKATGQLTFYQTVNPFTAIATGRYDAASGRIEGKLNGRWHGPGGGGLILGAFKGIRDKDGFHGKWAGENIEGRWTASIAQTRTVSWSAYMCQHYHDDFVRMGGKCP